MLVNVDDIIIARDDVKEKKRLHDQLAQESEIKELKRLKYFLRIKVAYSKQGILMSQRKYIFDLFKDTRMINCKVSCTPIDLNNKIGANRESGVVDKERY